MLTARYKIVEKIGQGAYGSAYIAHSRANPSVQVVIKRVSFKGQLHEDIQESLKEAQVLSMLDHPCILRHLEHFTVVTKLIFPFDNIQMTIPVQDNNNRLCIVTELAEVRDLNACNHEFRLVLAN